MSAGSDAQTVTPYRRTGQPARPARIKVRLCQRHRHLSEQAPMGPDYPWRTNRRWCDLLSLVRLVLSDRHQQTSTGTIESHALFFGMNILFEQYIERTLSPALVDTCYSGVIARGQPILPLRRERYRPFPDPAGPDYPVRYGTRANHRHQMEAHNPAD